MLAVFAEGITWTEAAGHPYAGTYVGSDAIVQNIFMRLGTEWDEYQVKPDMLIAEGDWVAASGWYSGTYSIIMVAPTPHRAGSRTARFTSPSADDDEEERGRGPTRRPGRGIGTDRPADHRSSCLSPCPARGPPEQPG